MFRWIKKKKKSKITTVSLSPPFRHGIIKRKCFNVYTTGSCYFTQAERQGKAWNNGWHCTIKKDYLQGNVIIGLQKVFLRAN